jgi:arsenate reductase
MCALKDKIKVLFICTGNSCRSQMAEGWTRHLKGDIIEAYSAGVWPTGISPKTIKVMAEVDVDISDQMSKHVDELLWIDFDYVVTLCDNAKQHCPVFPDKAKLVHKSFEDPIAVIGNEEKMLQTYRKTRDDIKEFIQTLPESLE